MQPNAHRRQDNSQEYTDERANQKMYCLDPTTGGHAVNLCRERKIIGLRQFDFNLHLQIVLEYSVRIQALLAPAHAERSA